MTDNIRELKEHSIDNNEDLDKILIDIYHEFDNDVEFGCCNNFVNNDYYEVYMFVSNKDVCASRLGLIKTNNKEEANDKFIEYKEIVKNKNIEDIKNAIK